MSQCTALPINSQWYHVTDWHYACLYISTADQADDQPFTYMTFHHHVSQISVTEYQRRHTLHKAVMALHISINLHTVKLSWKVTAMRSHLSQKTWYSWEKVLHFNATEPVTKDHVSREATFVCPLGWSFKTGSTVAVICALPVLKNKSNWLQPSLSYRQQETWSVYFSNIKGPVILYRDNMKYVYI